MNKIAFVVVKNSNGEWVSVPNYLPKDLVSKIIANFTLCSCKEVPNLDEERLNKCLKCGLPIHH